ncbi:MAG: glycogen debranching protein [Acidobacteria bacterium]|nr:MAG: glycogen debranching protein [Acidobacteriota bacterium]REJ97960.1 MAG: glycogen debranching protein [Acidobacteriota bacterium]REK16703.1 MAG: glycogen debranching protein [Acidobacteriota bacterium]REK42614.1 MAG: glycogen debranching protein [Acidobacteriota bacterium]
MITLQTRAVSELQSSTGKEWLETNGIGGYSSSTVSGIHTRRYHGLLVAATDPPLGRMVLLSKFEEVLTIGDSRYGLSASRYPGAVDPEGFRYIREFRLDPYPVWTIEVGGVVLERRLFMPHGRNTVAFSWEVVSIENADAPVTLEVRPLLAFRDYHHLLSEEGDLEVSFESVGGKVAVRSSVGSPELYFSSEGALIEMTGFWYRNFEYGIEQERGFDYTEDLYQPFVLRFDLSVPARLFASTENVDPGKWEGLEASETRRRSELVARAGFGSGLARQLTLAADQYLVRRGSGHTVIAGYPWFSDWGRDTMISLPGLTLSTGRPDIAKDILFEFSDHVSEGMLPNRFPDDGEEPEYNTVDATLWYFEAIRAYLQETGEVDTVGQSLYKVLAGIVDWHLRGTRHGIVVDDGGLLRAGEPGVQLTWMDARIGDWVVTPRAGKPVEIQALWYNALRTMEDLAKQLGKTGESKRFRDLALKAKRSFTNLFWNDEQDCLYDVVADDRADASIRPNQIFAVSLYHSMLSKEKARKVVSKVQQELLTPYGLRSLAASDPGYIGRYEGGPFERDSAYHQGTVWAWLLGPFIEAFRRVNPPNETTEKRVSEMLGAIEGHLFGTGLNQISEIFDAEPPHEPKGCFAQAWSVAEILRVIRE